MKTRFGVLDTSYLSQRHKRAILKEQQIIHNAIDSVPIENYIYDVNNDPEILDMGEKEYAYGVLIDFTKGHSDEDPGFITRIGNMDFHRILPCHTHRGQIYNLIDENVVAILNPDNWNAATEEHSAEEIKNLMEQPYNTIEVHTDKFYMTSKVLKRNSNGNAVKFKVMFSPVKINDRYIEVKEQANDFRKGRIVYLEDKDALSFAANLADDEYTYGGYLQYEEGRVTANYNAQVPATGINRMQVRELCRTANRECMNYYSYMYILYWAFVIEYCTFNCKKEVINELDENGFHQGGLGIGMTSIDEQITQHVNYWHNANTSDPECTTRHIGVTNSLGNHSGEIVVQENGHTYHQNRYRGFEFPFGDIFGIYDGISGFIISQENFRKYNSDDNEWKDDYDNILGYYMTNNPNNYCDEPGEVIANMDCVATTSSYKKGYMYDDGTFKLAVIGDSGLLIPCESHNGYLPNIDFCASQYGAGDCYYTKEYCAVPWMGGAASYDAAAGLACFDAGNAAVGAYAVGGCSGSRFIADN